MPRPFALAPEDVTAARVSGAILCHDVIAVSELGRAKLGKGRILTEGDVAALQTYGGELHLLEMEPGDVHEDEASARLARAIAGEGLEQRESVESQSYLRATYRGLLEIHADVLRQINALPDVSVFTAYDAQPVNPGTMVAATKVTPLAVPGSVIEHAEDIARRAGPLVRVRPFQGGSVGVVVRERLTDRNRAKFEAAIEMKVGWFGSPLAGIRYLPDDVAAIAEAITEFQADGVALILAAGVNSTDPLDLTIQALEQVGARTEKRGVPAHPGSTCWLAYLDETPIFGLALCGMFSKTTVLDLLLPHFLSGRRVRAEDLAAFGHGGILSKDMAFRFPAYAPEGD